MDPVTAPMSSPLKVRQRRHRIWATDAAGRTVLSGRTLDNWPERYAADTLSGTHRVPASVEAATGHYLPVIDAGGREIARIMLKRRKDWELRLATGESASVTGRGGGLLAPISCTVDGLSSAVAPRFAPQRYFTLTLTDAVLARPDRDALVVALTWISETIIAAGIGEAASAD